MFEDFVKEYSNKDRATLGNVYAKGYASPDGPVKFNDELSKKRSESGQEAIAKKLSSVNPKYDIAAYGEDWEGFKELVSASDIEDKDLILQVLAMQDNPVKRDEEIKSMTAVFEVLAKEILPQLRRTKLIADVDIEGRTDAEIKEAAAKNIDVLSEEEMLYAATLTDDNAAKLKAYEAAASKYNSVRGYNNAGVILAKEGKLAQAKAQLDKAAAMSKDAAITNNLGVVALMNGDLATAQKYLVGSEHRRFESQHGSGKSGRGQLCRGCQDAVGLRSGRGRSAERQLVEGQVDSGRREFGRCRLSEGCHRYARG